MSLQKVACFLLKFGRKKKSHVLNIFNSEEKACMDVILI